MTIINTILTTSQKGRHAMYQIATNSSRVSRMEYPFSLDPQIVRDIWTTNPESNWHENLEIELCISGEGEVLIEGTKHAFLPGDIAVANPTPFITPAPRAISSMPA